MVDSDTGDCLLPYNGVNNDFKFDRCFDQDSTQALVFDEVRALLFDVFDEVTALLFNY